MPAYLSYGFLRSLEHQHLFGVDDATYQAQQQQREELATLLDATLLATPTPPPSVADHVTMQFLRAPDAAGAIAHSMPQAGPFAVCFSVGNASLQAHVVENLGAPVTSAERYYQPAQQFSHPTALHITEKCLFGSPVEPALQMLAEHKLGETYNPAYSGPLIQQFFTQLATLGVSERQFRQLAQRLNHGTASAQDAQHAAHIQDQMKQCFGLDIAIPNRPITLNLYPFYRALEGTQVTAEAVAQLHATTATPLLTDGHTPAISLRETQACQPAQTVA